MSIITHKLGNGEIVTKHYNNYNQLHCDNGPAVVSSNTKEWYKNGERHNNKGYAVFVEKDDFIRVEWWVNGVLNRVNKPAVIDSNGTVEYWVDGVRQLNDCPIGKKRD